MSDINLAMALIVLNLWVAADSHPVTRMLNIVVWSVILCAGLILRFVKD